MPRQDDKPTFRLTEVLGPIFYETGRLRVVMSTANLINYDWRDVENAVWLQDIPPRLQSNPHDPKITDDFPSIMQHVLRAENVRDALTIMLTHEVSSQPPSAINRRPMLEMGLVKG
ncbi:hypothetical protein EDC04DRAFT_2778170 [Pisolithus marmoratus]|nr:hypothetical protein EDC04DRAFT_2778170 [Pisolithus marmoratus]